MKRLIKIFLLFFGIFLLPIGIMAQVNPVENLSDDLNKVNNITTGDREIHENLTGFIGTFERFFISDVPSEDGIAAVFYNIAYTIKNFVIMIAILFLVIAVLKLLFSEADDSAVEKWKKNIIWTTVGILCMQIAFPFFKLFVTRESRLDMVNARLGWEFWNNIISPIVGFILTLASAVFLLMMFYAFYVIITGAGEEDRYKKWKDTFIFAIIGFILIQLPQKLINIIYGRIPDCAQNGDRSMWTFAVNPCQINTGVNTNKALDIVATLFKTFNGFLTLICVILALYAWFLVLTSRGDESKISQAKKTFIYIVIGFVILIASHAIFAFVLNSAPR